MSENKPQFKRFMAELEAMMKDTHRFDGVYELLDDFAATRDTYLEEGDKVRAGVMNAVIDTVFEVFEDLDEEDYDKYYMGEQK